MKVPKVISNFYFFLVAFYRGYVDYRNRVIYPIQTSILERYEIAPDYSLYTSYVPSVQLLPDSSLNLFLMPVRLFMFKFMVEKEVLEESVDAILYHHTGMIEVRYCIRKDGSIKIVSIKKV